jgi:hypothetical protein
MNDLTSSKAAAFLSEVAQITKQTVVPRLQEALLEIPEEQAFALEMSFFEDEDDEDIASMMQVSKVEVQSLKQQAKESLMHTQFGWELETKDRLETSLKLAGRYWQNRKEKDAERYQQAFEKALAEL